MSRFENPPLPDNHVGDVVTDISFYKPLDSIILKWIWDEKFVSLVDYLDQDLLKTPPSSEDELSDDDIIILEENPFKDLNIVEECQANDKSQNEEEIVKTKETVPLLTKEEIEKLAEGSQIITIDEDHGNDEKGVKVVEIVLDSDDGQTDGVLENEEEGSKENACFIETTYIEDIILDSDNSQINDCKKRKTAYYQSTSHGNSSTTRRSNCESPKRIRRRCHYSPAVRSSRARERNLHHERCHSPRCRRHSTHSPDYKKKHRKSSTERYSEDYYGSPNEKNKRRKIIHYIDSAEDFELSEIKISSTVVKKNVLPTCRETSEENTQRSVISDDTKSIKKAISADIKGFAFETYYCKDCQLTLNSKLTWESHIVGKKHKKAIQCRAIHEIAKGSICIPNPNFESLDKPRFANPTAGKKHVMLNKISRLQRTVDEVTRYPMPGLDHITEIRSKKLITYYCELCDAPCQPVSIMRHLIGFNHQLLCLKEINREFYEEVKHVSRKKSMKKLLAVLFDHEDLHGKGRIRVCEETPDPNAISNPIESLYFDRPGPSWGNVPMKPEHGENLDSGIVSNDEYLDTSKSDFYCKLCDSHMNNLHMWAAHVRGKRHLKNAKKNPGEKPAKVKAVRASPNVVSKLESLLHKEARDEVIVGLDYIKETQSKNGEIYNCFLCCACATNYDIVDHILLTKHRTKYLEKMFTDGKKNGISVIANMDISNTYFRDNLIKGECNRMMEKYGKGKVEVYISKDI